MKKIHKPTGKISTFYQPYLDLVPDDGNLTLHLNEIQEETVKLVQDLSEDQLLYRYDKDKWSIKDILVHLADCERIFIYRATRIARGDKTNLPGFDEKLFGQNANADARTINGILSELNIFRSAAILFIETLTDEGLEREGFANGYPMSTRLLVNHIYGHHLHHLNIIKEKYITI